MSGEFVKMGARDIYGVWDDNDAGVLWSEGDVELTIKFHRFRFMRDVPPSVVAMFPSWCFREYTGVVYGYHVEHLANGYLDGSVRVP